MAKGVKGKGIVASGVDFMRGTLFRNMASLGLLQVANYLIPLLLIPFVTGILGNELFGRVSYAQNIITYLTLLVNYGFEYSATRRISVASSLSGEQSRLRETRSIFWSVMRAKLWLLVLSFAILMCLPLFVPRVEADFRLYLYTALVNVGFVLFPTWFLQGIQQMHKMALVNFLIKLLGAVLVLALLREASQYRIYPLLLSVSGIVMGVGALVYIIRHYNLWPLACNMATTRSVLKDGAPIFINNLFIALYTTANLTILGAYADDVAVGHYSGAMRLIMAVNMCVIMPVSTALFPEMSRRFAEDKQEGWRFFRRTLLWASVPALLASLVTWLLASPLVHLMLHGDFEASIPLLRWMAPLPLLIMTATLFTVQGLYGSGLQRFAPWVGMTLAVLCVSMNMLLIPRVGTVGAVWSWLIAEAAEILIVGSILLFHRSKTCST